MLCPSCGKEVPIGVAFCRHCGTSISNQKKLIQEGYAEVTQSPSVVQPVYVAAKSTTSEESIISNLLSGWSRIPGIIRLIVVFILLNVALWGAQELYYWDDSQRMKVLDAEITDMDNKIQYMENFPYTTTQSQYESLLSKRNKEADEYNALVQSSGSRWYLIPIPTGHHTTH
jgi:hypothetical protein